MVLYQRVLYNWLGRYFRRDVLDEVHIEAWMVSVWQNPGMGGLVSVWQSLGMVGLVSVWQSPGMALLVSVWQSLGMAGSAGGLTYKSLFWVAVWVVEWVSLVLSWVAVWVSEFSA